MNSKHTKKMVLVLTCPVLMQENQVSDDAYAGLNQNARRILKLRSTLPIPVK